jgi:hypothetical protein
VLMDGETYKILQIDPHLPNSYEIVALTEGAHPSWANSDKFETLNEELNKMGLNPRDR